MAHDKDAEENKDAYGGNFGWKYATKRQELDPETDGFFLISAGILLATLITTTMVFALLGLEWSFWHWLVMGVLGAVPAFFTVLLGIGVIANRLH